MDPANHRHTQIDMHRFTKVKTSPSSDSSKLPNWNSPSQTTLKRTLDKKRPHPPDEDAPKPFPKTSKVSSKTDEPRVTGAVKLRTAWESPWEQYEKVYDLELAGAVEVAVRKKAPVHLVHVRRFSNAESEKVLHRFRQLLHPNIVVALDVFMNNDGLYVVLEHMSIALERIVTSPAYPTEQQLAAILGQLLNAMAYLAEKGFAHGCLSCSNILLNVDGTLKIANQECCHSVVGSDGAKWDLRDLSSITMELMQKYVREDGAIAIDNVDRWDSASDAVRFLTATTSAKSVFELLKHPLLTQPWKKESLMGLVSLAQICVRGRYKYMA